MNPELRKLYERIKDITKNISNEEDIQNVIIEIECVDELYKEFITKHFELLISSSYDFVEYKNKVTHLLDRKNHIEIIRNYKEIEDNYFRFEFFNQFGILKNRYDEIINSYIHCYVEKYQV